MDKEFLELLTDDELWMDVQMAEFDFYGFVDYLTEEEAKEWYDRLEELIKYHRKRISKCSA
ncbi:hypothetical protein [Paenibacillus sp. ATY16]|uniref:hypothetical protein n=1 Tax=Paenibacillus sp. ATY16 TaxID=1759312 RepID=UPI00200C3515|nr:hypothetical protein [Paenibacillus sp. ATY16]MCK9858203.1 hypothetical protein [Paenibacillus sp. ATY16]